MTRVKGSITVDGFVDDVYGLASDAHKWQNWFVGMTVPHSVEGDVVKFFYYMVGRPVSINMKITPPSRDAGSVWHWDCQLEGDLRGWMKWTCEAVAPDETLVTAEIDYMMPGGLMGKGMKIRFIESCTERALRTSLENLKALCLHDLKELTPAGGPS